MSQYALLIALLLVLFAVAVLVAYLIARIKELSEQVKEYEKNIAVLNKQVEILEKERAQQLDRIKEEYENLLEERKREKDELSERLKEYEKNIAVLNKQLEMLEKEKVRYENLLEEREKEKEELSERLKEYEKNIAVLNKQMDKSAYERAQKLFEEWREKELEKLKDVIKKDYENLFEKWKNEYEEKIREDSRKKSLATTLGKVGEEITPLLMFKKLGIEPKDFRHIGTPIDYVAFKGLSNGKVEEIVFIEVKTGNSPSLSDREKEVRKAVEDKRVRFLMINLKEELYNFRFE
jgi:predicted Holliday junction resolvase-like endonuclease